MRGDKHVFMAEAGDGEGGGGAVATSSADNGNGGAAASSAAAPAERAVASEASQGDSALQQGAQEQPHFIPEKYQVKKEDGTLDIEASAKKLAEGNSNLEKRLGTGDLPPKTADEYQITVPDALKDKWNAKEDPLLGEFLKDAHAAGMTQKQVDLALSRYMDIAPKLVAGAQQLSAEDCTTQLKAEWKTDEQYKAEVGKAYKAAVAYGDKDAESIIRDYGNDPRIVRFMARVGNELGEDKSLNQGGSTGGQSVESLMTSEAYTNQKHPDHARVSAQVQKHFEQQAAAAEKSGTAPVL